MIVASSGNYARDVFGFLSSTFGQIVLAVASVLFLAIVKSLMRPSGEHAFRWDDLAIGPDLIVLSIITLIGYAVSQYAVESKAEAAKHPNLASANNASGNEVNAGFVCIGLLIALFGITFMVQRLGQYSTAERKTWTKKALEKSEQNPASQVTLDAPRFKLWFGVFAPVFVGILLLIVAIRVAVHR